MAESNLQFHLDAYALKRPLYIALAQRLSDLLKTMLEAHSIDYHVVEARAKSVESFREKLIRPGKSYKDPMKEMPDLCGCRIIAYYQDDCAKIANLIKAEFKVLEEELSHQPSELDADRFGYISAHYVVKLAQSRARFVEWKPFKDLRAEIQIRTVIQHAWSAVSHAVQYKEETKIPSRLQRRLYRIAGLFELADEEFVGIREQRAQLLKDAATAISSGNTELPLTSATIHKMLQHWQHQDDVVKAASEGGFRMMDENEDADNIADIYDLSSKNKIRTISDLQKALEKPNLEFIRRLGSKREPGEEWTASPFFLANLSLIAHFHPDITENYLVSRGWDEIYAQRIVDTIRDLFPTDRGEARSNGGQ